MCFITIRCKEPLNKQVTPRKKTCKNNDIPLFNPQIKVFDKMLKKCLLLGNIWKHLKENCLFHTNSSDIWSARPFYHMNALNNHFMLCTGRFLFIYNKWLAWDENINKWLSMNFKCKILQFEFQNLATTVIRLYNFKRRSRSVFE